MMVSPSVSPSSLNSSTYFTDRQWAMCRISPSPKKPFSMLLQASSNVTLVQRCYWGGPSSSASLRTRIPRAFFIATDRCSVSSISSSGSPV